MSDGYCDTDADKLTERVADEMIQSVYRDKEICTVILTSESFFAVAEVNQMLVGTISGNGWWNIPFPYRAYASEKNGSDHVHQMPMPVSKEGKI
jgi:hypothetical protein